MQSEGKHCILEFQAFRDNLNDFIVKELVIIDLSTSINYSFLFKPPYSFSKCNTKSRKVNNWLTKYYHHISWSDGNIAYSELSTIMERFCKQFNTIFTTGTEKTKWITTFTSVPVITLSMKKESDYNNISSICLNIDNPQHKTTNCALARGYKLMMQIKQQQEHFPDQTQA